LVLLSVRDKVTVTFVNENCTAPLEAQSITKACILHECQHAVALRLTKMIYSVPDRELLMLNL